jgi:hypothetical protein
MWRIRFIIKFFLSLIPLSYKTWNRIGIFKNGKMKDMLYSRKIFDKHIANFTSNDFSMLLELGPGDSASTAIYANQSGFKEVNLVENGDTIEKKIFIYNEIIDSFSSFEQLLNTTNCNIKTNGLKDMKVMPSLSASFVFSNSVLQHVFINEIEEYFFQLYRISKYNTQQSHTIDFKDMFSGEFNHLKIPTLLWESKAMKNSGFYTNRIRFIDFIALFNAVGFNVKKVVIRLINSKREVVFNDVCEYTGVDFSLISSVDFVLFKGEVGE